MVSPFSAATRAASLTELADTAVDVLVIGGGITGSGIARDAAMRGFRTALVERTDFAAGTSGRSSRLIHGGLRYLEHGAFRLVHEATAERRILLRIAPHLVWPQAFLFPLFAGGRVPRWQLAAGMWLYDALASFRNVERHRWLSKRSLLRAEPRLRAEDLLGGARYFDAQCDDARLTLANARDAHGHGALVATYAEARGFDVAAGRVRGVRLVDRRSGAECLARAHVIVNATGPWSDEIRQDGRRLLLCSKGAHVVVPRARLGLTHAVTLLSPVDGRVMFALPWGGDLSYIGTTETAVDGSPDTIAATADDVVYLLRSANAVFPDARLHPADVVATWAGIRPLARPPQERGAGAVSREHIITERPGMISIVGGKLTTYRRMARDVVDRVAAALHELDGRAVAPRAPTDRTPLPGGETADLDAIAREVVREGLASPVAHHLVRRYGSEAPAIARLAGDPALARPIAPGGLALRAELIHAVEREMALTLCDLLVRRTHAFYQTSGHAMEQAPELAALVAPYLGWSEAQRAREVEAYRSHVEREESFRRHLPDGA